jgi:hypothetical protein
MAAIAAFGAGLVHVAAAGDHDKAVMAVGFEIVALLQVGLGAMLVMRRASAPVLAGGLALMLASISLWALSRTVGLEFIPGEHVEPIGFRDSVCVLFELVAAVGLWELLTGAKRPAAPPGFPGSPVPVLAVLALALGVPALATGGHDHTGPHDVPILHAGGPSGGAPHAGPTHPGPRHRARAGSHPRGHGGTGGGHTGDHAARAGDGHAVHAAATGTPAVHAHAAVPAAAHTAHTVAPETSHADAGHTAPAGASHAPGHSPAPGGAAEHPAGHDPAPPPAPPEAEPPPTLTDTVAQQLDALIPGRGRGER